MIEVIFLDFDGVINNTTSTRFIVLPFTSSSGVVYYSTKWSADCIGPFIELMKWCKENNIKIVISSTWRLGQNEEVFNNYFKEYFIYDDNIAEVIGVTSRDKDMHRGKEIYNYCIENNINNFLVIDDDIDDIEEYIDINKIIHINSNTGLTYDYVNRIKKAGA